jgi:hypothetical protein
MKAQHLEASSEMISSTVALDHLLGSLARNLCLACTEPQYEMIVPCEVDQVINLRRIYSRRALGQGKSGEER